MAERSESSGWQGHGSQSLGRQAPAWRTRFDQSGDLTCVLNERFQVVYCNRAWDRAATANGVEQASGAKLFGQPLLRFVPRALEYHYSTLLETAREKHISVFAEYECNTPSIYRRYQMKIVPVPRSSLLALIHTVVKEGSIPYRVHSAFDHDYGLKDVAMMCAQCRRTKQLHDNIWDWVPEFVHKSPRRVSFGVCDECTALYCREPELR